MNEKNLEFLEIIHRLFGEEALPFTDYMNNFQEMMNIDIKELLGIYTFSLENGYIKTLRQDRIYLTEKGGEAIKEFKPR